MKPIGLERIAVVLFLTMLLWIAGGCASSPRPSVPPLPPPAAMPEVEPEPAPMVLHEPPETKESMFYIHKVRWSGETLSAIAGWYTGEQANWELIAKANSNLEPKLMHLGDEILVPVDILITREPMPREYIEPSVPQTPTIPPSPEKPVAISDKTINPESLPKGPTSKKLDEIELFEPQEREETGPDLKEIDLFEPIE